MATEFGAKAIAKFEAIRELGDQVGRVDKVCVSKRHTREYPPHKLASNPLSTPPSSSSATTTTSLSPSLTHAHHLLTQDGLPLQLQPDGQVFAPASKARAERAAARKEAGEEEAVDTTDPADDWKPLGFEILTSQPEVTHSLVHSHISGC